MIALLALDVLLLKGKGWKEAVLGANVVLTMSTKIIDISGDEPIEYEEKFRKIKLSIQEQSKNIKSGTYKYHVL